MFKSGGERPGMPTGHPAAHGGQPVSEGYIGVRHPGLQTHRKPGRLLRWVPLPGMALLVHQTL